VAKHCSIPQAAFADPPAARVFPKPAEVDHGRMTGGRSHGPVTVATAQGIPVSLADNRPCRPIPALTMVSNPGVPGPVRRCGVSQVPHVDLFDEIFLVWAASGWVKPLDVIL